MVEESDFIEFFQDEKIKKAIDSGVLKILVSNNVFTIANAANSYYVIFPYFKTQQTGEQVGMFCHNELLEEYLKYKDDFGRYYFREKDLTKDVNNAREINDEMLMFLIKSYQKFKDSPAKGMDPILEKVILSQQKQK